MDANETIKAFEPLARASAARAGLAGNPEAVQAARLGIWRAVQNYKPEIGVFFAIYVKKVTRAFVLSYRRGYKGIDVISIETPIDEGRTLHDVLPAAPDAGLPYRRKLRDALSQLNRYERMLIDLYYIKGFSRYEIADMFDTKRQYIDERINKILAKLRRLV